MTYKVGDDAAITYPVTDNANPPGNLNFTPVVKAWLDPLAPATHVQITGAEWDGDPGATRDLVVPLATLERGLWGLGLVVDDGEDLFLGNVYIQ